MSPESPKKQYVEHLRHQFSIASPILFLGAGFSLNATNVVGQKVPSANSLVRMLWHLCFPGDEFDDTTQLQDIFDTAHLNHSKELKTLLTDQFTISPSSWPPWYPAILTMPWKRIYTLNIDNLVEEVLSRESSTRGLASISALSPEDSTAERGDLAVIHLNGKVQDAPDDVTFSRSQYARRQGVDRAYSELANDLRFRPIVFLGSSLDEGPLWAHMELRGTRSRAQGPELRQRSYLVVPSLNRSKEALLARYNVVWIKNTAQQFATLLSSFGEARQAGNQMIRQGFDSWGPARIPTVQEVAERSVRTDGEYLLGAEPVWEDVDRSRIAKRSCFEDIWAHATRRQGSGQGRRFIVITGTAGVGKTSALMVLGMRLSAAGQTVGWIDKATYFDRSNFRRALEETKLAVLLMNDADVYGRGLSEMVRDALEVTPNLLLVCEMRSSKVESCLQSHVLQGIDVKEYTVPGLGDEDIEAILDVLEREHRLGQLKGKSRDRRRAIFKKQAGRQLLVAMHIATSGRSFEVKVHDELQSMSDPQRLIYGLISVATAHRFALRKEDIGIACGVDSSMDWVRLVSQLERRKLILLDGNSAYIARHRVVAQFAYDSLVERGQLGPVTYGLIRIGATKTTARTVRNAMSARLLRTFLNHNYVMRVGVPQARQLYSAFEAGLAWSHHFWLHRGALEVEQGDLGLAENFLHQASAINPKDVLVDTELAYLMMKKANASPGTPTGTELVKEALALLDGVVNRRSDQAGHAYHIAARQGLLWAASIGSRDERYEFLDALKRRAEAGVRLDKSKMMRDALTDVERELLRLAVREVPPSSLGDRPASSRSTTPQDGT